MEQVDGVTWGDAHLEQSEKKEIIDKLVGAVEHIHELGISHGDLHPENVMIGRQDRNVYLIDIPDFSRNLEEKKNHRYSPENIDSCSAFERDIFAVLKMSSELINLEWGGESQEFPSLAEAIRTELDDTEFGFRDLGRFKKALNQTTAAQAQKCVEIELSNLYEALTILPDNGRLFVKLEASRKDASEVSVTFSGIGGTFTAFYNKDQRCFVMGKFPRARTNVNSRDEQESQFEIGTSLRIKSGKPSQFTELSEYLRDDEAFNRAIDVLEQVETAPDQSELSLQLKEAFEVADHSGVESGAGVVLEISTRALWRAILETESQSSPNIELNGSAISPIDAGAELILPYEADIDPLGAFSNADEVEALLIDPDGTERNIGEVSLKRSALNEVRLTRALTDVSLSAIWINQQR